MGHILDFKVVLQAVEENSAAYYSSENTRAVRAGYGMEVAIQGFISYLHKTKKTSKKLSLHTAEDSTHQSLFHGSRRTTTTAKLLQLAVM